MESVKIRISMTRLTDNKTVEFEDLLYRDLPDYDGLFIWDEGNYSCDCNRSLFFARAASEDEPDEPCGSGQYKINWIKTLMGDKLYGE